MDASIEQHGINPGLSPWRLQIAMLPVRRVNPDDDRNAQRLERIRAGQQAGIDEMKWMAERNRARILRCFRGRLEFKASQIALKTGLALETARYSLNGLVALGVLEKRRENRTDWFVMVPTEGSNAKSQGRGAALSRQVACTDGLGLIGSGGTKA